MTQQKHEEVQAWMAGRLPDGWFSGPADITVDREEILVVGPLADVELEKDAGEPARATARAARIDRFREEARQARMRVARSFAFIDLSGFTTFTDEHGDEEAGRILSDFRTCVRTVCSRRGVRVAKWQGDGAMFVAVEAPALVEAVLDLEQRIDRD